MSPMRPIEEQVILVTGATDGLGRAVSAELLRRGATVLLHGRDDEKLHRTLDELEAETGSDRLDGYLADFSSLHDVRDLAGGLRAQQGALDVVVNNAGLGFEDERVITGDGIERVFQVDYLAGYLLTRELLPLLEASAPARIVNVSSLGQQAIDFDDVNMDHGYESHRAYCQAKLAQILHAIDLSERLPDGVTINALHPATFMPTKILAGREPRSTLQEGVDAVVRLVVDPALEGVSGRFYNVQEEARADDQAYDADARARLRELSEALVS
jgi:NAD(P)-dependent dehydrogenase (short-subunit alcohol dehydrogenase family)